jgi:RND family efflux transporter MFP subunit
MTSPSGPADQNGASASATPMVGLHSLKLAENERRSSSSSHRPGIKPPRRGRRFFACVCLFVVGTISVGAYRGFPALKRVEEVESIVFTNKAEPDIVLDVSGYIVPRRKITVSSEVGGLVRDIPIEEGSRVERGQLLLKIEETRFRADRDLALAQLQTARAQLLELQNGPQPEEKEQAKAQYDRDRHHAELMRHEMLRARRVGRGGVSQSELDHNVLNHQEAEASARFSRNSYELIKKGTRAEKIAAARAEVSRAQANLDKAEYLLRCTEIKAPIAGVVVEKKVEVGESVHPEVYATPMITLAELARMEADIPIQERDLRLLNKSYECKIIPDAFGDRTYKGRFVPEQSDPSHHFCRIQPQVNRQRGVVQVRIAILDPDSALLPDMNCRVLFIKDKKEGSIEELPVIPLRARIQEGSASYVFVFDSAQGVAQRRAIECGSVLGSSVQVRSGLNQGDIVLLPGDRGLTDGKAVRPKKPATGQKGH